MKILKPFKMGLGKRELILQCLHFGFESQLFFLPRSSHLQLLSVVFLLQLLTATSSPMSNKQQIFHVQHKPATITNISLSV